MNTPHNIPTPLTQEARINVRYIENQLCLVEEKSKTGTLVPWEVCANLERSLVQMKESEKIISDAYLRIRALVNAYDTNYAGENRFEVTENKITQLTAQNERMRRALGQFRSPLGYCNCCNELWTNHSKHCLAGNALANSPISDDYLLINKERIENLVAAGRPHGSNAAYPDGCECDMCELWDELKCLSDSAITAAVDKEGK